MSCSSGVLASSRRLAVLLWWVALPACTCGGRPELPPRLDAVEPAWGYSSEVTAVVLRGANFTPRATLRLGGARGDVLGETAFQIFLGEEALLNQAWASSTELTANVPAGLAPGKYTVRIVDPWGVEAALPEAFEVRAAQGAVLTASISTVQRSVRLGNAIEAWVDLTNSGDAIAQQVTVTPSAPSGTGGVQLRSVVPASASIAPGQMARFTITWVSTQFGMVTLGAGASGVDARSGQRVSASPVTAPPIEVTTPPVLLSSLSADRLVYSVGQEISLELQVDNAGPARVLGLTPSVVAAPSGAVSPRTTSLPRDLSIGATERFPFSFDALAAGQVTFDLEAVGVDEPSGAPVAIPRVSQSVTIVSAPALSVTLAASASQLSSGERFTLTATVTNGGQAVALAVTPVLSLAGPGGLDAVSAPFTSAVGAQPVDFQWEFDAANAGSVQLTVTVNGLDENSGQPLTPVSVMFTVLIDPSVDAGSSDAGLADAGEPDAGVFDAGAPDAGSFDAGSPDAGSPDAGSLDAGSPDAGVPDAGGLDAGSPDAGGSDAGGSDAGGSDAGGPDAGGPDAGGPDAGGPDGGGADAGSRPDGGEVRTLFADPFGDGTPATFVIGYRSKVYVGPNRTGAGAVRFDPDGTSPETISFSFSRDTTGNTSSNSSMAPYPSLGSAGCTQNTPGCGPDNENGRGLFFEAQLADAGWLGAGGGRTAQSFSYVYLTPDTDTVLDFRYVDISNFVGAGTCQLVSAINLQSRAYFGMGGTAGGRRPVLIALDAAPPAPGLDPNGAQMVDLQAEKMPGISNGGGASNNIMLDAMGALNDRLYLGAYGGWVRSTTAVPGAYGPSPGDWTACTPSAAAYGAKTSTTTTKRVDLEPADRAVPAFAAFAGRLYAARNTTAGPQLWGCNPALTVSATDCDPGDWALIAPNSQGDVQLTQFDDAANVRITLLEATPTHLYVGFNNATRGVVVFRTSALAPQTRADFTGTGGCAATLYPLTCDGYGGSGLGEGAGASRIYDSVALPFAGADHLYVAIGDGTSAVKIVRVEP